MRRLLLGLALVATWPTVARAQTETADQLRQAQDLYERLEIERALPLLRQVVSPSWPHDVTQEQRVEAYTYLGAALALLGMRDSAIAYFRDAIERDPFTDLDAQRFTPAQLALFGQARRITFAVAARPVAAARVDPRTERATLTVVSTHSASVRVELRPADRRSALVLFDGVNDGLRELGWDGLLPDGHLAPPGRYELAVVGRSQLLGRSDSARVYFTVAHETPPLEDSLPELAATQLLPERLQRSAGRSDLLKGLAVAAGALVVSGVAANGDLGGRGPALAIAVGGTAGIAGVAAFLSARHEHDLSANIEENNRRRAARAATNASIAQRNAERIAQTVLVIQPAAGVGP
jgi:tetratricopeptide (TPR) repeat protein